MKEIVNKIINNNFKKFHREKDSGTRLESVSQDRLNPREFGLKICMNFNSLEESIDAHFRVLITEIKGLIIQKSEYFDYGLKTHKV